MKLNISAFSILLVGGLLAIIFVLWCLSLLSLLELQNERAAERFREHWQSQVVQLQQNQQRWLQSQFHLFNTLAESLQEEQKFQSFVLDYYQRNPNIWAVIDGRLYLFHSLDSKQRYDRQAADLLDKAEARWQRLVQ